MPKKETRVEPTYVGHDGQKVRSRSGTSLCAVVGCEATYTVDYDFMDPKNRGHRCAAHDKGG